MSTAPPTPPSLGASFQFGSTEEPLFYETFLASRPAQNILREVLAEFEKEPSEPGSDQSRLEATNLRLVDKLKRFRTRAPAGGPDPAGQGAALLGPLLGPCSAALSSGALGGGLGPVLNAGLRRNRSYPAMVGASMAMKDPGGGGGAPLHTLHPRDLQTAVMPKKVPQQHPWPDDGAPKPTD